MTCRERLERLFLEEGIAYKVTPHPLTYTARDLAASEHISGYDVAKVVVLMVDQAPAMIVLPGPLRVDLEKVRAVLGARTARLATEREFSELFPDCDPGAMPPFGNLYGVPMYVDRSLLRRPEITFNAGTHRETVTIASADFARLTVPRVVEVSAGPPAEPVRA